MLTYNYLMKTQIKDWKTQYMLALFIIRQNTMKYAHQEYLHMNNLNLIFV